MNQPLEWLPNTNAAPWRPLADSIQRGLPVPDGYVVFPRTEEKDIRAAYDELKLRVKTHFLAVRGSTHAVLNVIGPDPLIHTLRRLRAERPDAPVLVQQMIHSVWCGKAQWHRKNLRIKANEGMLVLDPDTYLVNSETGKCLRRALEPKQRKMIRHVDGSAKVVAREGERTPMPAERLKSIADLAARVNVDFGWAIDDLDRVWLITRS